RPARSAAALLLAWLLLPLACGEGAAGPVDTSGDLDLAASHARMLTALRQVVGDVMGADRFLGDASLLETERKLAALPAAGLDLGADARRHGLLVRQAADLLRLGRTDDSVEALADAEQLLAAVPLDERPRAEVTLLFHQALAWLRLGERGNCVGCANPDSCLFPLRGGGLHELQAGSQASLDALTRLLQHPRCPASTALSARWLLNIAYMTLGQWPDEVPEAWLIGPDVWDAGADFPRYRQVAADVGLGRLSLSGGAVVDDLTGDGRLDVMVSTWHYDGGMQLFRNAADGSFEDVTEQAGLAGLTGGLNMEHVDIEGDGDMDVLVLRGAWFDALGRHPNSLLINDGSGHFQDAAFAAGLAEPAYPTQTGAFADYDGDGDLDLYVGNEDGESGYFPSQLFRARGDGSFEDVARQAGVENLAYAKAVAWGDVDDDGDPDLYVSNLASANRLYLNQGDGTFVDQAAARGVQRPLMSFPSWFWDVDNDGQLDLYVAAYVEDMAVVSASWLGLPHEHEAGRLFMNRGGGRFDDRTQAFGLSRVITTMGANFGDLDNDGWLDMYLGTGFPSYAALMPNVMLRNVGGARFEDVSAAGGFGHLQKAHGVAFADLDDDGDLDVFEEMGGAYAGDVAFDALYENPGHGHHWLRLQLVGAGGNRSALGARVTLGFDDGGVSRQVHRQVGTGGSFGSSPLALQLGLGDAERVDWLELRWAWGPTQRFTDLAVDRCLQITQGEDELLELPLRPTPFRRSEAPR
ncbi:MAG: hypothetical protein DRQ55_18680, partial [Planctomycetota bacterium]